MNETQAQQPPAISNIAGIAVAVIIVALTSVIVYQQGQLAEAVKTLAVVSAKCSK